MLGSQNELVKNVDQLSQNVDRRLIKGRFCGTTLLNFVYVDRRSQNRSIKID
jgi:ribosomal protein S2